jgi:D-alanyl-D-alanine carboxypeptidase
LLRSSCLLAFVALALIIAGFLVAVQLNSATALLARLDTTTGEVRQSAAGDPTAQTTQAPKGANVLHPNEPIPLLVNESHPLAGDSDTSTTVGLLGIVPVADDSIRVNQSLVAPLSELFAAAQQAGISSFYVSSAYRSQQRQEELYREAEDKSYVQKPGNSEHQTGLAVDLAVMELSEGDLGQNATWQWLAQHAWEYGFILRYPAGKEAITGIAYEPWHFRYVGEQIAQYCFEQGFCLEEYVAAAQGN